MMNLSEEHRPLWTALLEDVERRQRLTPREVPSSRGIAMIHGGNPPAVSVVLELAMRDELGRTTGEGAVYLLTARYQRDGSVTIGSDRFVNSHESYWTMQLENEAGRIVVDGIHYRAGIRRAETPPSMRGFGGRRQVFRRLSDGDILETDDLWYQGPIPPMFRDRLPDTHERVEVAGHDPLALEADEPELFDDSLLEAGDQS